MTDYLAYMRMERAKLGEEFNRLREKILQYSDIIKQLEKKAVDEEMEDFKEPWIDNLSNLQIAELHDIGADSWVFRVKLDHKRRKAVTCNESEVAYLPYEKVCTILGISKR